MNVEDERALTSAMILHEKAKNLIKSKAYLKALLLLAQADNDFKFDFESLPLASQ